MTHHAHLEAFRQEVRAFLDAELSHELAHKGRMFIPLEKDEIEAWERKLQARGWFAGSWPQEFGGTGWTAMERYTFEAEMTRAYAPRLTPFGITMLGPVLHKFGSPEQQAHWLPRILNGDDWWAQGYSEPGAGSDLASLKTTAVRDGDTYTVNGQKTWTTMAQFANMMFALVRTDPDAKPQQGISFLLIDMDQPGVEVRPIELLDGSTEVNEVFLDDVKVPVENLVGEENQGWTIAKYLLTHERTGIAGIGFCDTALRTARSLAQKAPHLERDICETEIELRALRQMNLTMLEKAASGVRPGIESSMLKIKGTVIRQRLTDLARRAWGPWATLFPLEDMINDDTEVTPEPAQAALRGYLTNRKISIYGGTNEIQRQIIAKELAQKG